MTKRLSICVNASPVSSGKRTCSGGGDSGTPSSSQAGSEDLTFCYSPSKAFRGGANTHVLSKLTPFLLIGDDRVPEEELQKAKVTAIIDCRTASEQELRGLVGASLTLERLSLPMRDNKSEDASKFFYAAVHFIERQRKSGGVILVHCTKGISRSPAVCCAYLIWANNIDCRDALFMLKARHPTADPNPSFSMQLADFAQIRHRGTVAFQVSEDGRALVGPLNREEAEKILQSVDGMLLVVSRTDDRQFVWCANKQGASRDVAKCVASVLISLRCAPEEVIDVSESQTSDESGNPSTVLMEPSFLHAIESLN